MLWSTLLDWSFEPVPIVGARRRPTCTGAGGGRRRRLWGGDAAWDSGDTAFALGIGALLLALVSPISYFDTTLQWDHMVQHVLLLLVAPPLILLADPFRTAWAGYLAAQGRPIAVEGTWPARAHACAPLGLEERRPWWCSRSASTSSSGTSLPSTTRRSGSRRCTTSSTSRFLLSGLLFWDQVISPVHGNRTAVVARTRCRGPGGHVCELGPRHRHRLRDASAVRVPAPVRRAQPARGPGDRCRGDVGPGRHPVSGSHCSTSASAGSRSMTGRRRAPWWCGRDQVRRRSCSAARSRCCVAGCGASHPASRPDAAGHGVRAVRRSPGRM